MSESKTTFLYPRNIRFHCTRCTTCCGDTQTRTRHIFILKDEATAISEAMSKTIKSFAHLRKGHEPYVYEMRKNEKGKCVFLEDNKCAIYGLRPLICRYYPFELKSQENGQYAFLCTTECLGLGSGRILRESFFRVLFRIACERLR
jgi:Fe-S-cluster containining protein